MVAPTVNHRAAGEKLRRVGNDQRKPLFSGWLVVLAAVLAETALILCLLASTAARSWSLPVFLVLSATILLSCFVVGEMIRWRFRLSLKVFLALFTLAAMFSAIFGSRLIKARQQQRTVTAIVSAGGDVGYKMLEQNGGWTKTEGGWLFPNWVADTFGKDLLGDLHVVSFDERIINDARLKAIDHKLLQDVSVLSFYGSPISNEGLAHLAPLKQLENLALGQTKITDAGLQHLRSMRRLTVLRLHGTSVTDAGLPHLYHHSRLRVLLLQDTQVTEKGVNALQRALPDCKIYR